MPSTTAPSCNYELLLEDRDYKLRVAHERITARGRRMEIEKIEQRWRDGMEVQRYANLNRTSAPY